MSPPLRRPQNRQAGMTTFHLSEARLAALLAEKEGTSTFAPAPTDALAWMDTADGEAGTEALRQARPAQSAKGIFLPAAESVGRYGAQAGTATRTRQQTMVAVGVRACELRARSYLDKVFLEGTFKDDARTRNEFLDITSG